MRQRYQEFQQRKTEVLAISSEDQEAGRRLKAELDLPFPLVVDTDLKVIHAYGVFHENEPKGRSIARPATFLLDSNGVIIYRYIGVNATDRPSADQVLVAMPEAEGIQPDSST